MLCEPEASPLVPHAAVFVLPLPVSATPAQPEMVVPGKMIYESFSYTLYGQRPGELLKQYQIRLEDDLIQLFVEMLNPTTSLANPRTDAPTDPHLQAVQPPV